MNLHLLIIEDDSEITKDWKEKLEFYEADENPVYTITSKFVSDLEDAKKLLSHSFFDAAVIDIRLASNDGIPNKHGNELLNIITKNSLAVSAIYTGETQIVALEKHQEDFIKVFEKGSGKIPEILQWFDQKFSMISAIQNMQNSLKTEMAKVFSKSIWPRWDYWLRNDTNIASTESALRRHMATHLHASFLNEAEFAHPEEYYFIPPLHDKFNTGDIFKRDDNCYYILVTPRCDLARAKIATFQLVKLESIKDEWDTQIAISQNPNESNKRQEAAKKAIGYLVNHGNRSPKSHFVPQIKIDQSETLGPFHAQFNFMTCEAAIEETEIDLMKHRIATLSNEFVPSLVERLGAYFSRIGTPDYSHPD